jgi:hypothetical protein
MTLPKPVGDSSKNGDELPTTEAERGFQNRRLVEHIGRFIAWGEWKMAALH